VILSRRCKITGGRISQDSYVDDVAARGQPVRHSSVDNVRIEVVHHESASLGGVGRVDGEARATGDEHGQLRQDQVQTAFDVDGHPHLLAHARVAQDVCKANGPQVHLLTG